MRVKVLIGFGLMGALAGNAAADTLPSIALGRAENYCVTYCYVRAPFTVANYDPARKIGRVFCDLSADVTARLPAYNGEAKTKEVTASEIGVFKNDAKGGAGDVELNTGILSKYFIGAKLKSIRCHF